MARDVLAFPEGLPDPSNEEETLLHTLNRGRYTAEELARVDDFVVRALFERKFKSKTARKSEAQKFTPSAPLPNPTALAVAERWKEASKDPTVEWIDRAGAIWVETVTPMLHAGAKPSNMEVGDGACFKKYANIPRVR